MHTSIAQTNRQRKLLQILLTIACKIVLSEIQLGLHCHFFFAGPVVLHCICVTFPACNLEEPIELKYCHRNPIRSPGVLS